MEEIIIVPPPGELLLGLNVLIHMKCLGKCLAHSKQAVNVSYYYSLPIRDLEDNMPPICFKRQGLERFLFFSFSFHSSDFIVYVVEFYQVFQPKQFLNLFLEEEENISIFDTITSSLPNHTGKGPPEHRVPFLSLQKNLVFVS